PCCVPRAARVSSGLKAKLRTWLPGPARVVRNRRLPARNTRTLPSRPPARAHCRPMARQYNDPSPVATSLFQSERRPPSGHLDEVIEILTGPLVRRILGELQQVSYLRGGKGHGSFLEKSSGPFGKKR